VPFYPDDFEINFQLAWSLDHARHLRPDDAVRFYTAARSLRPRNIPVTVFLADALCSRRRLDEAIGVYRQGLALKGDDPRLHQHLGAALRNQDRLDEAISEFRQVISLNSRLALPHLSLGLIFQRLDKGEEAMAEWREAVALEPRRAEANFYLASALRDRGEFVEALIYAQRSQTLAPRDRRHPQSPLELIEVTKRLVRLRPGSGPVPVAEHTAIDPDDRVAYAELYYHQQEFDQAARFYERAFADKPELANNLAAGHRLYAARSAARAGSAETTRQPGSPKNNRSDANRPGSGFARNSRSGPKRCKVPPGWSRRWQCRASAVG
jgi:tetratricopeptide (TPR) repeat protein